ncbi:acetyltransferase [Pseudomaricurvus alkylphenolicus]|jgi:hypothetical protein|uniref:acetyltransferase n=1 Tax=Pseudomaricurvus alkylphenolicus TaxID=1306991 RepID=UPI00198088FB|nr:acetyltransferase [Pseudomaricurvus alkylphenolicus]
MLMMIKQSGALVELSHPEGLWNPYEHRVMASRLAGEEQQDPEPFLKAELAFLSGEHLPKCWVDPHYRDEDWLNHGYDPVAAAATAGPTNYYGA